MRLDIMDAVLRGGAEGERKCDGCRQDDRKLWECRVVHATHGESKRVGYWYDFCEECIQFVARQRDFPADKAKADRAMDDLIRKLRERCAVTAAGGVSTSSSADQGSEGVEALEAA